MAWGRVDDGWWCHPKVMGLSLAARGLWVSSLSWSCAQRRDLVPTHFVGMVGGSKDEANELAAAGLWVPTDTGWVIHDWADYQGRTLSEKRSEAGRKGGIASGQVRRGEATPGSKDEAKAEAGPSHPIPTRPDPPLPPTPAAEPGTALALVTEAVEHKPKTYTAEFETWWAEYPRKIDKALAAKAYQVARRSTSAEHLLDAVRIHAGAWAASGTDQSFIVYPERWLKRRRYDEPPELRSTPSPASSNAERNRQKIAASVARLEGTGR